MSPDTLTANQLSLVISQAAAPAFLLGAVASFLSVLVSHMNRVIDRSRAINAIPDEDATRAHLKAALPQLKIRATLVNRAIYWAVGSGIFTCLLMISGFVSAYFGVRHEPGAAILFTLSLGLFTAALISFAREVKAAVGQLELG
jgi:Protein of unknown function (DUF2721)